MKARLILGDNPYPCGAGLPAHCHTGQPEQPGTEYHYFFPGNIPGNAECAAYRRMCATDSGRPFQRHRRVKPDQRRIGAQDAIIGQPPIEYVIPCRQYVTIFKKGSAFLRHIGSRRDDIRRNRKDRPGDPVPYPDWPDPGMQTGMLRGDTQYVTYYLMSQNYLRWFETSAAISMDIASAECSI